MLLKLSSLVNSRKISSSEGNRQWHHINDMYSRYWLFTYPLVWAVVFIRYKAMREAHQWIRTISSHTLFCFKADLGSRKAQRRLIMKKLFATCLLLLNILPAFAYVRDDRDSGTSGISLIIVLVLFIIGVIKVCKGDGK